MEYYKTSLNLPNEKKGLISTGSML
jgi:hypothetical protein